MATDAQLYNLLLFTLYKTKGLPRNLSKLAFLLDKDSLLNLCEYYGGETIEIPTLDDLRTTLLALTIYQGTHLEGLTFDAAVDKIGYQKGFRKVKKVYDKICKDMEGIDFNGLK